MHSTDPLRVLIDSCADYDLCNNRRVDDQSGEVKLVGELARTDMVNIFVRGAEGTSFRHRVLLHAVNVV